ncbi:MAG TPA: hypothetical protein VLE72_00365 [Candidatus Saccharimonadales bacterium]|nr:hypothetical protein [Candidatus Saccharimonadales bacterium]
MVERYLKRICVLSVAYASVAVVGVGVAHAASADVSNQAESSVIIQSNPSNSIHQESDVSQTTDLAGSTSNPVQSVDQSNSDLPPTAAVTDQADLAQSNIQTAEAKADLVAVAGQSGPPPAATETGSGLAQTRIAAVASRQLKTFLSSAQNSRPSQSSTQAPLPVTQVPSSPTPTQPASSLVNGTLSAVVPPFTRGGNGLIGLFTTAAFTLVALIVLISTLNRTGRSQYLDLLKRAGNCLSPRGTAPNFHLASLFQTSLQFALQRTPNSFFGPDSLNCSQ